MLRIPSVPGRAGNVFALCEFGAWQRKIALLAAIVASLGISACQCATVGRTLQNPNQIQALVAQQDPSWCWVATSQMVLQHFGYVGLMQCNLANIGLGRTDCCPGGSNPACSSLSTPDAILHSFPSPELSYTDTWVGPQCTPATPISWCQLVQQINNNSPVISFWSTEGTTKCHSGCSVCNQGGHFRVAVGYDVLEINSQATDYVWVADPEPVNVGTLQLVSYDDWACNATNANCYYGALHWSDFSNFSLQCGGPGQPPCACGMALEPPCNCGAPGQQACQ
jgi:hypothetical protein